MRQKYIVKQNDIKDCGICCLESIIKYYNGYIPLETLRLDTKTNNNGTTAYNLIKTAKKYGFNAIGKKYKEIDEKDIILPAIAHIITNKGLAHFVVIYKISQKYIYIMDPSKGYLKKEKSEFLKEWTNIILIFKPYKTIPLYKIKKNFKKLFIESIFAEKKLLKEIILTNFLITILSIASSYYFKTIISSIESNHINSTITIVFFFLILNIIKIYHIFIKNNLSIYLSKNIDLKIVPSFINHILNLPLNVIKSRTSGEILIRVRELNNLKNLFNEILINVILNITLIISSAIFLNYISKELFLILCIIALLYIIIGVTSNPILIEKINDNIDIETDFNSELSEKIKALETIKNLNLCPKISNRLENKFVEYTKNTFEFSKFLNLLEILKIVFNDIGLFVINAYGIYLIYNKNISFVSLITFNSLISYFIEPIKDIISLIPKFQHIKLSYNKISEFINIETEKQGNIENFITGNIRFEKVSYSYNDYDNILNNINIILEENKHYLIKGSSGSGKSTLCQMINRNIDDYKGNISINDVNIKDYSLSTLRKNILYVSQREELFTDTILNNITLNEKVPKKELLKVLKITKVDEIINKKSLRLESLLYDNGFNLSGGERQRIILARSLIYKPKILILDESLCEIDSSTEESILKDIDNYLKNTTIIYISHTNCDCFKNKIEMEKLYVQ